MDENFRLMCAAMAMQGLIAANHPNARDSATLAARAFDIANAMGRALNRQRAMDKDAQDARKS